MLFLKALFKKSWLILVGVAIFVAYVFFNRRHPNIGMDASDIIKTERLEKTAVAEESLAEAATLETEAGTIASETIIENNISESDSDFLNRMNRNAE